MICHSASIQFQSKYALRPGHKLWNSDCDSIRNDGAGAGHFKRELVQGDVQREDWVCVFAVHTADAESDADPHADAYPNPDANAGSDSNAYADTGAHTGSRF